MQAHFIYEPAQDSDSTSFRLLQTDEEKVSPMIEYFLARLPCQWDCMSSASDKLCMCALCVGVVRCMVQERVEAVAALLEVRRVGWVLAHPPREEGFFLSG